MQKQGKTEKEIADEIGLTTTELRVQKSLAKDERRGLEVATAKALKEKGYGVYFLSNMSGHVINSNAEAFGFVSHMDGGVWSCDVHVIKPDAEIYRILFEKYGLVPEECIFIDDHRENIAVGKKSGMKGIVFKDYEQLTADLEKALTKDAAHDSLADCRATLFCYKKLREQLSEK